MSDRAAAVAFFERHFGARRMVHPGRRPLEFIDILNLRPGEASINISPPGPYPGMAVGDPARWRRQPVPPAKGRPAVYGVHWLGIATRSLDETLRRLEVGGVEIARRRLRLPAEPGARAALVWGPDFNGIALVERPGLDSARFPHAIDHVQLLVRSVAENERFFADVYGASVASRSPGSAALRVAGATFVLSEPPALGLRPGDVAPRDPALFRYEVDHVSFLYDDVRPAHQAAAARGRLFPLEPRPLAYFGEPTPYVFGFTLSPDGLQCEMLSEQGRRVARRVVDEREFVARPDPEALPWRPLEAPGFPPGVQARLLRESALGPRALVVRYPRGFRLGSSGRHRHAVERFVLAGGLEAAGRRLVRGHYAYHPAGAPVPDTSAPEGATVLEYWAGPPDLAAGAAPGDGAHGEPLVVDTERLPWAPSTVTQPGQAAIPLLVRRLRDDAATGARTWMVAIVRGVRIPWEAHSTPEEGFLLEGDYVQPECQEGGVASHRYLPGGYFWRPARAWHSGPGETTSSYAVWLLRTPRLLDVEFSDECKTAARD